MKLRNPFIRRIARHLNVSTLFRRPDPAADDAYRRRESFPAVTSSGAFPEVATLLPEAQLRSLPVGYAAGAMGTPAPYPGEYSESDETQQVKDRVQQAERYSQSAPALVQTAPVSQRAVQPVVEPTPAPIRPLVQPEPGAPTDALSREWPRLQAIMRGHEAVQNSPAENPPVPAVVPTSPAAQTRINLPPSKPVVTELDQEHSGRKQVSLTAEVSDQISSSSVLLAPVQSKMESANLPVNPGTVPLPFDDRLSEQTESVSSPLLQTEPHPSPVDLSSAQVSDNGVDDAVPVTQTTGLKHRPEQPTSIMPSVQTTVLEGPAAQIDSPEETPTLTPRQTAPETFERIPLQEAWPVQRQVDTPHTPMAANQPLSAEESTFVPVDPQQIKQIEETLKGVAVSQPTDSRVELITPRRPRPGAALQAKPVSPPQAAPQAFDQAPATEYEPPENPPIETLIQPAPAASAPQIRRDSPDGPPVVPPQMVETEIGPLPADLWQLMGAEPPAERIIPAGRPVETAVTHRAEQHTKNSTDQPSIFDEADLTVDEAETQREPSSTSLAGQTETPLHTITPLIQRTAQIDEMETEVSQEPAGGETNQTAGGQASGSAPSQAEPKQNAQLSPAAIDKLVREVYAQIKRRFSVERERLHKD